MSIVTGSNSVLAFTATVESLAAVLVLRLVLGLLLVLLLLLLLLMALLVLLVLLVVLVQSLYSAASSLCTCASPNNSSKCHDEDKRTALKQYLQRTDRAGPVV